jgi:hypothetical protein
MFEELHLLYVAPCGFNISRRLKHKFVSYRLPNFPRSRYSFYPEDGGDTSVYNKPIRPHIREDCILHSHRRENLLTPTTLFIYLFIYVLICSVHVLDKSSFSKILNSRLNE